MAIVVHHLPITKARVNLGQLVRRVNRNKEYFILEKDGIPVAGIMGANELEDYLELQDPKVREHIRNSNADYLAGRSRPAKDFLAGLRGRGEPKAQEETSSLGMTPSPFSVLTSKHYERLARILFRRQPMFG